MPRKRTTTKETEATAPYNAVASLGLLLDAFGEVDALLSPKQHQVLTKEERKKLRAAQDVRDQVNETYVLLGGSD